MQLCTAYTFALHTPLHSVHICTTVSPVSPPTPTAPETACGSLREQKRRDTMAAIEDAATALVAESGYDAVTVDDICARARISRRTFFNYVPSKEAAVVGTIATSADPVVLAEFRRAAPADPLTAALHLVLAVTAAGRIGDAAHASTVVPRRRKIFRDAPELATARLTAFAPLHQHVATLLEEVLTEHPDARRLPDLPVEAEVKALVGVVFATVNLGMSAWLARPGAGIDELDRECLTALDRLAELVRAHPTPSAGRTTDPAGDTNHATPTSTPGDAS